MTDQVLAASRERDQERRAQIYIDMQKEHQRNSPFAVMLQHDAGWVAVLDQDRYVGVLTPASLHTALRKSVDDGLGVTPEETVLA